MPGQFGNKGGGRKSARDEHAKNEAIRKAWLKVEKSVEKSPVKDVALPLALKDITTKTDLTSLGEALPILVEFVNKKD